MATSHHTTTVSRATALLTAALVVVGPVLAGCSADAGPDAGAAPAPTSEATRDATGTPEASPTHESPEPSGTAVSPPSDPSTSPSPQASRTPSADPEPGDEDEQAGPGNDDSAPGEHAEPGAEPRDEDDPRTDVEEAKPKLPEFVAYGEQGQRVTDLQERLRELGYHLPAVDGAFGGETRQALWALQKAAGLYRDGVVGPATRRALENGTTPQARTSSGKVIEIDIDRQLLLAVEDGRVVRTINAATGNGERFVARGNTYYASTPRGDFSIYREIDRLHSSTLELGSMYRPKYFNGPIAVHGSGSVPPVPASHGCVRVSNSAIAWIWDEWGAPRGTRVLVY